MKIYPNSALPFIYERTSRRNYKYEVKRGESYASIAADNGITEEELKAANPDLKKVKKGKVITLPKPYQERLTGDMATISLDELRDYYEPRINDLYDNLVAKRLENEINIAIVLPFQLHKSAPPRQAYLYTDFYKGFLLAMDSVSHITDKHVNLKVYDTAQPQCDRQHPGIARTQNHEYDCGTQRATAIGPDQRLRQSQRRACAQLLHNQE